jgi:superoxide dismutase, Fe-Mn family
MENTDRRDFLKKAALTAVAVQVLPSLEGFAANTGDPFSLPALKYPFEALEPHIDSLTMQIHHGKHHQAYVNNLNKAVTEAGIVKPDLMSLMKDVSKYSPAVRNNGGGHYNHTMFWELMTPAGGGEPTGPVSDAIKPQFGSFAAFKEKFNAAATGRFGSGWAWLVADKGKLTIGSTPNQDNPLMDVSEIKGTPIIGLDVWEHAYYLKYQNKRVDYVNAWWNIINWNEVNKRLAAAN